MEQELLEEMLRDLDSKQKSIQETVNNLKVLVKNELRRINLDETNRNIASISSDSVSIRNDISKLENDLSITNNNTSDNTSEIKNHKATLDDLSNKLNKTNNDMTRLFSGLDTRLETLENKPEIVIPKLIPGDNVSIVDNKINVTIPQVNLDGVYSSLQQVYKDIETLKTTCNGNSQTIYHLQDTNETGCFVIPANATFVGNITIKNVYHKSKINATTKVMVNETIHNVRFGAGYADGTSFIWETVDIVLPVTPVSPVTRGDKVSIVVPDENYLDTSKISYSIDGIVIV